MHYIIIRNHYVNADVDCDILTAYCYSLAGDDFN